ncbi:alginate export family protein [Leptospira sp. 96542]|nr:alginate export family protein [Leptospira sp. 96542]
MRILSLFLSLLIFESEIFSQENNLTTVESKPEIKIPQPTWMDGFSAGAMLRIRPEMKYNYDFNSTTNDNVDFVGQKLQFWIQKDFTKDVIAKITFQDSRLWGGEKGSVTGLSTANDGTKQSTDIREAYIEIKNNFNLPFHVQAGRQILKYGDERLVGSLDWSNVGRSFDGIRFKWDNKYISSHIWVTNLTERHSDIVGNSSAFGVKNKYGTYVDCPPNGKTICNLKIDADRNELGDSYFTGFYNTIKPSDYFHIDLYYIGVQKEYLKVNQSLVLTTGEIGNPENREGRKDILHTYGVRFTNKTQPNKKALQPFDYSFEYATQTGTTGKSITPKWDTFATQVELIDPLTNKNYKKNLYSEKEKYKTFAFGADFGYTIDKLRLGAGYDIGSGDPNRTDGSIASFQNLFHTNHVFYGMADQVSWVNMKSKSVNLTYTTEKYGSIRVDYFVIEKHKLQDSWYEVSGISKPGASTESISNNQYNYSQVLTEKGAGNDRPVSLLGKNLFREIDIKYNIPYQSIIFEMGYSIIIAGDAIKNRVNDTTVQSNAFTNQFNKEAQFAYLMMTANF